MDKKLIELPERPEEKINTKKVFGFDAGFDVFGFKEKTEWVPMIDETYVFDESNTRSILAGFMFNRRVMIQGYHGTGKSTHLEQVAARLNWQLRRAATCLLYTSPSPRDQRGSRMPSSA